MNLSAWKELYDQTFSLQELYDSKVLKAVLAAVLLAYVLTFSDWINHFSLTLEAVNQGKHLCWPYFKSCGDYYFLSGLPYGYTSGLFYMILFAVMGWSAWAMLNNCWRTAHALLWPLFIWKALVVWVFSMSEVGNYEYYHLVLSFILLALPHKIFFLKFGLVWFYFLSTAAKIHPTWTLGVYFTSLKTGLPLFPDSTTPIWTNLVILMEMIGAWWLLGPKHLWQRLVFVFFVIFHLYSGLLVSYRYPATVLPTLFILFGPWYQQTKIPTGWSALPGWLLIFLLGVGQSISHFIPGDEKLTMEGNFYGLYMFEANHQCIEKAQIYRPGQAPEEIIVESARARGRCDVYRVWFKYQQQCQNDPSIERVAVTFDHSLNGAAFYRIVEVPNICELEYKPFKHNDWITLPNQDSDKIGYPMRNYYY